MSRIEITKEFIIEYLRTHAQKTGQNPNSNDFVRKGHVHPFCAATVRNRFGSWADAVREAGFEPRFHQPLLTVCINCSTTFNKMFCEIKRTPNGRHFCSNSCAATYNNAHKTIGTRRSQLEQWLEARLGHLYDFEIIYNKPHPAVGFELDIRVSSLDLAFEINGIHHYEPIYGDAKLNRIQTIDQLKVTRCNVAGLTLVVIDTRAQKHFSEATSWIYLTQICNEIDKLMFLRNFNV